jgi:hypothetical protein
VRDLVEQLAVRGETTTDLLSNLFKAYKVVPDHNFEDFVKRTEEQYDQGDNNITADRLMDMSQNKFRVLVDRKEWNAPTADQEKIIALETQIATLKKSLSGKKKPKDDKDTSKRRDPPAWKLKPPGPNEKPVKEVKNKKYHWCTNHKMWCIHSTEQCKGVAVGKSKKEPAAQEAELQIDVDALMANEEEDEEDDE